MTGAPSHDGFAVAVTIDDTRVREALAALVVAAGDMRRAFDDIGASLTVSTQERFARETDPSGGAWKPLSPATILARLHRRFGSDLRTKKGEYRKPVARELGGMKILQDAGHLRGGIHHVASADGVDVGSDRVYARIQQFGGQAGRGRKVTIPARPFLGLSPDDETMIVDTLRRHWERAVGVGT